MDIDQTRAVNAILQHDDTSTAAELVYYFVHELNVPPGDAWKAVYRQKIATSKLDSSPKSHNKMSEP